MALVRSGLLAAVTAAALAATPALADTPLTPPGDFTHSYADATVTGSVMNGTTVIAPIGIQDHVAWTIPVWARYYLLSPDRYAILVLNDGGNLIGSRDPDQIVATTWALVEGALRRTDITLGDLMNPDAMPQTASHYVWLTTYKTARIGWQLGLSDGRTVTLPYR